MKFTRKQLLESILGFTNDINEILDEFNSNELEFDEFESELRENLEAIRERIKALFESFAASTLNVKIK